MHYFDGYGGMMGWGALWMVLWWVLPILGVVGLMTWIGRKDNRRRNRTAIDLLKERYARGEISQEEYRDKMRDLGG